MADLLHGWVPVPLQNQANQGMPSIFHQQDRAFQGRVQGKGDALITWDTDRRYRISEYLSKHSICNDLGDQIKEMVAESFNETKTVAATSQGHYLDLDKLNDRMSIWFDGHENCGDTKDGVCLGFSSPIGSTTWSSEVQQNMDVSAPDLCHSLSTANCGSAVLGFRSVTGSLGNSYPSSVLVPNNGLSASHGDMLNDHHQIVPNLPVGFGGNVMHSSTDLLRRHSPQSMPGRCTGSKFSPDGTVMPPNNYTKCRNEHLCNLGGNGKDGISKAPSLYEPPICRLDLATSKGQAIDNAATLELSHRFGDSHFRPDSKLSASGELEIPSSSFGCEGNYHIVNRASVQSCSNLNHAASYSQSNLQFDASLPELLWMDFSERGSKLGFSQPSRLERESRPFLQGLHVPKGQFTAEVTQLEEDHYVKLRALGENMISGGALTLNLKAGKSQMQAVANLQHQPPQKESLRDKPSMFNGTAIGHISGDSRAVAPQQKHWMILSLFEHARNCSANERRCEYLDCRRMKECIHHVSRCNDNPCPQNCNIYKALFHHYDSCCIITCSICSPVREMQKATTLSKHSADSTSSWHDTLEYQQSPLKRMKTENFSSLYPQHEQEHQQSTLKHFTTEKSYSHSLQYEMSHSTPFVVSNTEMPSHGLHNETQGVCTSVCTGTEMTKPEWKPFSASSPESLGNYHEAEAREPETRVRSQLDVLPSITEGVAKQYEQAHVETSRAELDVNHEVSASPIACITGGKMSKQEAKGASLIDTFTREQIEEHLASLRQCFGQSEAKVRRNEVPEDQVDDGLCSLCGMEKLLFAPLPLYCASCTKQISPKRTYYITAAKNGTNACKTFCNKCYNTTSGDYMKVAGEEILKAVLERKLNYANDAEAEEWVSCGKCGSWHHQICALFNDRRNQEGQAEYTCPCCLLRGLENGEHQPLGQTMIPGAEELPTTYLSDHIEQWLFRHLKNERQERAKSSGKSVHEVASAEGLFVRVVSSVDKIIKVNQSFREIFEGEYYPEEFPYTSKAILLFQKIKGAGVCIFAMYVQEYGAECAFPNQRHVCLSYIDSVKYFRPDVKAITGEALRTFVYHEILIGYLDYCKRRGFVSCYIWACPPTERDDYILYSHPDTQKMPKADKLRDWYRAIVQKAKKESVIVDHSNLYDQFFIKKKESKVNITAARMPYFDGDHWPGQADILLRKDGSLPKKKGAKAAAERAVRAAKRDASIRNEKDTLLMHQLGEIIRPMKEDFIMVHLCHSCKHCCQPIISGKLWACKACKNFFLCEKCYDMERNLEENDRHRSRGREKHTFYMVEMEDLPADTYDKDKPIHSRIFDTRMRFLGICQENHYQFDTLRRAKHSTMMLLYHLHNPRAPAFKTSCILCLDDIKAAQGWHCMICSDYDICDVCYRKEGGVRHDHELVNHSSMANHDVLQNESSQRNQALKALLDLLLHASRCHSSDCTYRSCRKIKQLFHHGKNCQIRYNGGCKICQKMWLILRMHARTCTVSDCRVPRCMDLKEYLKKKQMQNGQNAHNL